MDPVPLAEDEGLHARVPAPGLVTEVGACFEQAPERELLGVEGGVRTGHGPGVRLRAGPEVDSAIEKAPSRFCLRSGRVIPEPSEPRRQTCKRWEGRHRPGNRNV